MIARSKDPEICDAANWLALFTMQAERLIHLGAKQGAAMESFERED